MTPAVNPIDPAQGAADLLRRFGMALLGAALPCAAFYSRRAAILLMPMGAILIFMGTVIDPAEPISQRLRLFARSSGFLIFAALLAWAGATIAWSPFPVTSAERLYNTAGIVLVAGAGAAAIPTRMRAPSLYFLPIGAFAAVIAACVVALEARGVIRFGGPADPVLAVRGAASLTLLTPVALGWLLSRGRGPEAGALAIGVLCAIFVLSSPLSLAIAALTIAAFAFARLAQRPAAIAIGALCAALILAGPALPFLIAPVARGLGRPEFAALLEGLADSVRAEGLRLLTGHGLELTPRAMAAGVLPLIDPPPLLVALWFDLGALGAAGAAALVLQRSLRAAEQTADVAAAEMALICCVVAQAIAGVAALQAWWMSSLAAAAVAARAIAQGQFRTRRPRARLFAPRAVDPSTAEG